MSYRRSSIKGAASFKRLIKALPDSAHTRIVSFLNGAGPPLAGKMESLTPVLKVPRPDRTAGAARASIAWKVTPATMNLKVGELTKRSVVFYAHILDVGRKAGNVKVTRGTKHYPRGINVRALKPLHIVNGVRVAFRIDDLPGYRTLMDDILLEAAKGAGDD